MHFGVLGRFLVLPLSAIAQRTWLQACLIALPLLHVLLGLPAKEIRFDLDATNAQPHQGHGYILDIPEAPWIWQVPTDSMRSSSASTLRLYEDGKPVGRPHTAHADIASKGGGAYSHWDARLFFAASDNSDPRSNGHKYHVVTAATLGQPIKNLLVPLIYLAGVVAGLGYVHAKSGEGGVRELARALRQRITCALATDTSRDAIRVGLIFAPFALGLSLFVAPFITVDGQVLLAFTLNDFVMPHYTAGYPFFARSVNFVTEIVFWPLRWQAPSGFFQPSYSGASLRILMLLQHTLTILAVSYFAVTVAKSFRSRVIVAAILYFLPPMLVFTHAVWTEGPSFALLVAATAELVKFSRFDGRHRPALVRFYLFIGAAALLKHVFIVFAGMPLGCALMILINRRTRASLLEQPFVEAKYLLVGLVSVVVLSQVLNNQAMRLMGIEPRSALGRAFAYRLSPGVLQEDNITFGAHQFFRSDAERRSILEGLKQRTPDETQRHIIDIVGQTPNPWVVPWNAVERFVATECRSDICQRHSWVVTDELLNAVARTSILSGDWRLWRDAGLRTLQFVSPLLVDRERALRNIRFFSFNYLFELQLNEGGIGLDAKTLSGYRWQLGRDLGVLVSAKLVLDEIGGLLCMVGVAIMILLKRRIFIMPTTLVVSAMVYAGAGSIVSVYTPRYGDTVILLALLALIIAVLEARGQSAISE